MMEVGGLLGLVLLVLVVWALVHVFSSNNSPFSKAIWTVLLIVLPFIGFIIWLLFGPRKAT